MSGQGNIEGLLPLARAQPEETSKSKNTVLPKEGNGRRIAGCSKELWKKHAEGLKLYQGQEHRVGTYIAATAIGPHRNHHQSSFGFWKFTLSPARRGSCSFEA